MPSNGMKAQDLASRSTQNSVAVNKQHRRTDFHELNEHNMNRIITKILGITAGFAGFKGGLQDRNPIAAFDLLLIYCYLEHRSGVSPNCTTLGVSIQDGEYGLRLVRPLIANVFFQLAAKLLDEAANGERRTVGQSTNAEPGHHSHLAGHFAASDRAIAEVSAPYPFAPCTTRLPPSVSVAHTLQCARPGPHHLRTCSTRDRESHGNAQMHL